VKLRKVLFTKLIIAMVLIMGACGNSEKTSQKSTSEGSGKATVLKYNSSRPATDPIYKLYEEYFKKIEEKSNGAVKFEMYPSESLGKTADMIEAASKGEPVVSDGDFAYLGEYYPDLGMLTAPYFIREPEDWIKLWDLKTGKELFTKLEDKGLKVMANFYVGPRNLITTKKVKSRDDVKGMTLRTASSKMWTEVGRVLGGEPTNIPISEVYEGLSQGVADGGEMSTSYIDSLKWYEAAPYIAETEHILSTTALVISSDVYNSLPEEGQTAIDEATKEYMPIFIEKITDMESELKDKLKKEGVTFTKVDKEPFIEAASELPKKFTEWTPGLYDKLQSELGY